MTVVAFKDGVMAADSQLTAGTLTSLIEKIWRLPDGGVVAGSGTYAQVYAAAKYLAGGESGAPPDSIDEVSLLIARPDGSLWAVDGRFPAYPLLSNFAAIGCGADAATQAMRSGATAFKAVASVIGQDAGCSWPIQTMEVVSFDLPGVKFHAEPISAPRKRK